MNSKENTNNNMSLNLFLDQISILQNLESGLTFKQAIKENNIISSANEIMQWCFKGFKGEKYYVDFYKKVSPYLIKITQNNIIIQMVEKGKSFENSLNSSKIYHSKEEILQWCKDDYKNKNYEGFYETIRPRLKKKVIISIEGKYISGKKRKKNINRNPVPKVEKDPFKVYIDPRVKNNETDYGCLDDFVKNRYKESTKVPKRLEEHSTVYKGCDDYNDSIGSRFTNVGNTFHK